MRLGSTITPFILSAITLKVVVYGYAPAAPAERADTLPLFYMYSVGLTFHELTICIYYTDQQKNLILKACPESPEKGDPSTR